MTSYLYPPYVAISQDGTFVPSGSGTIYAETDTSFVTPLTITDASGNAKTSVAVVGGLTEAFYCDYPEAVWVSGNVIVPISSPKGLRAAAEAAQSSAYGSANSAAAAASQAAAAAQAAADAVALAGSSGVSYSADFMPYPRVKYDGTAWPTTRVAPDGYVGPLEFWSGLHPSAPEPAVAANSDIWTRVKPVVA